MLLRRLIDHVRAQNWTAVALDFLIVVVGVFIGIQVSNWNSARTDARREHEILRSILTDIVADQRQIETALRFAEINIDAGNYALMAAGSSAVEQMHLPADPSEVLDSNTFVIDPPPDDMSDRVESLWQLSTVRYFPAQNDAALDALITAGDLSLITNREIIENLQEYRQLWSNVLLTQDSTYRPFRNQAVFVGQRLGLSPFAETDLETYTALLASDEEVSSSLRTLIEFAVLHRSQLVVVNQAAHDLTMMIQQELNP
ncbi:MAG: hypothetical protein AAF830_06915 [Pseudomonadota bacterium]